MPAVPGGHRSCGRAITCPGLLDTPQAVATESTGALRYQGTHILACGALPEVAERCGALHPGAIEVTGGGCDEGIAGVTRGGTDLEGPCCPVKASAAEGLPYLLVAHDLKAVVVHPWNPSYEPAGRGFAVIEASAGIDQESLNATDVWPILYHCANGAGLFSALRLC